MSKYTKADIKHIAIAMRRQKKDKPDHPFALITGAGCSKSAEIPLAGELTKLINNKFPEECEILDKEDRKKYGACMAILSANECRDLFKPFLKRAKVNWGHIAIASMMDAGFIGRVLTFNFDSILAQACGLLGLYPATYDFVTGVSDRTDFISNPAILHLHGQGHGIAMLNSDEETEEHAKKLRPLLTWTFSQHPTLIIGYSGSSDAVFDHMCDIYTGAERLTWVGYNEDCPPHVRKLLNKRPGTSKFTGGADSDEFLMELALELGCWPPKLFIDPHGHLLDDLEKVTDHPGQSKTEGKDSKVDILSTLRTQLAKNQQVAKEAPDRMIELFLESKWSDVIAEIGDNPKTDHEKNILASAKFNMAFDLGSQTKPDIKSLEKAEEFYNDVTQIRPRDHHAFNNWGNAILALARLKPDEKLFKKSFEKYEKAITIKADNHEVFYNWGNAIFELAKLKQDENLFKDSFEKYEKAIKIKADNHQAFNNWGAAIQSLAKVKQDENLFKKSFEKFEKAINFKADYHEAFNNWGNAISYLAQMKQDENLFKDSFEKFEKAINFKADYHESFYNWVSALLDTYTLTKNPIYLDDANEKAIEAQHLNPDKLYNLACAKSLKGSLIAAKDALLHCEFKGTLPDKAHLESDTDLDPLRGLNWFKELLARQA